MPHPHKSQGERISEIRAPRTIVEHHRVLPSQDPDHIFAPKLAFLVVSQPSDRAEPGPGVSRDAVREPVLIQNPHRDASAEAMGLTWMEPRLLKKRR